MEKAIETMKEKGLEDDPRYAQLLALQYRTTSMNGAFSLLQMKQLRNQIMAYR